MPWIGFLLLLLAALSPRAQADGDDDCDQECARQAVEAGLILPLSDLLQSLKSRIDGRVVGTELEREGEKWIYEIKFINAAGSLIEMTVDAQTGALLESED